MARDDAEGLATVEDLLRLPDDVRAEVIGGQLIEKASPAAEHGLAQLSGGSFLFARFHGPSGPNGLGGWWFLTEVEIELETHEVYRPDLCGWRRDRMPERPRGRPLTLRPDWVCEVLSRSNAARDLVTKLRVYARAGVPHYWIIDPDEEVLLVYRHHEGSYTLALSAARNERVRAEPFDAVELPVGILFGDDCG